jgi:hypothetical protein
MSTPENQDLRGRLLTYLFWGGISLAPLAALLLIVVGSSTTGLRFAALLAILAVVAIGLSVTLRRDATSMKLDIEETLLDEIDMLRNDVRTDITTAARATHRALSEKMAHLHESVDQVRRQQMDVGGFIELDRPPAPPAVTAGPPRRPAVGAAAPPGVVQRTETVRVTTRTIVDPDEQPNHLRGPANGSRPALPRPPREVSAREASGSRDAGAYRDGGAYRDAGAYRDDSDHSGRGRRDWDEPRPPVRELASAPDDSWPEQRVARNDFEVSARQAWQGQVDEDPGDDPRWTGMSGGDRWAEVRHDERGRELRMGERRTAIRTDETGTQMRIVDRWSSVREERPRHDEPNATFENTGETRAQRRAREESGNETRAALPSAERSHREEPWRDEPRRDEQRWDDARRDDARRDDGRRDESQWDSSRWTESRRADANREEPRRSAGHADRDDRDDRAHREDRPPLRAERRARDAGDDEHDGDRASTRRDREPRDRDTVPGRSNGKVERDAMRDSGFIPRPLDQPRRDEHAYAPEIDRIPAQRAAERYEEPRSRRDHRDDTGDRSDRAPHREQPTRGQGAQREGEYTQPTIRRRSSSAGPREALGGAPELPAGPRDGQWPPATTGARPQQRDRDDDNRWEREPSGQRSQMRRPYDFEVNDERWH